MKVFFSLLTVVLLFSSCYKYEEGPRFSLLSRKARLCNEWRLEAFLDNGTDKTVAGETTTLTIEKDGTYSISTVRNELGQLQSEFSHGTWEFQDAQGQVVMTDSEDGSIPLTFDILELRSSRLQLRKTLMGIGYVYKYKGK